MAASNLNLGKASGGVLNVQPADGTTTTSLVLPAINGTVVAADNNGNVGIGIAPVNGEKLQVKTGTNRNLGVSDQTTITGAVTIEGIDDTRGSNIPLEIRGSTVSITRPTGTTAVFDSSGNVGVGTNNPSAPLEVVTKTEINAGVRITQGTSNTSNAILQFTDNPVTKQLGAINVANDSTITIIGNTERMRIDTSGNVGIGTTATRSVQNAKLYVNGGIRLEGSSPDISSATGLSPHIGTGNFSIYYGEPGAGIEVFRVNNSYTFIPRAIQLSNGSTTARLWTQDNESGMNYGGNAPTHVWMDNAWFREATWGAERSWENYPGITCTNDTREGPVGEFRIHGINGVSGGDFSVVTRCDGGYVTGSDARRKTNIESITNAIDTVKQLDGKSFNIFNRDLEIEDTLSKANGRKFGFIAQDIEDIIPEAVKITPDTEVLENGWASGYAVDYGSVVALLTNAIKEQQAIIDDLKARIEILEGGA